MPDGLNPEEPKSRGEENAQESGPLNLVAGEGVWDRAARVGGVPRMLEIFVIVIVIAISTLMRPIHACRTSIILLNPHHSPELNTIIIPLQSRKSRFSLSDLPNGLTQPTKLELEPISS